MLLIQSLSPLSICHLDFGVPILNQLCHLLIVSLNIHRQLKAATPKAVHLCKVGVFAAEMLHDIGEAGATGWELLKSSVADSRLRPLVLFPTSLPLCRGYYPGLGGDNCFRNSTYVH